MLAGLPKEENMKLQNIHFIAASNQMGAMSMLEPIIEDLQKLENGIIMFDAALNQNVMVVAPVLCILADNARSAEVTNHCGSSANRYCRICEVMMKLWSNNYSYIIANCTHTSTGRQKQDTS